MSQCHNVAPNPNPSSTRITRPSFPTSPPMPSLHRTDRDRTNPILPYNRLSISPISRQDVQLEPGLQRLEAPLIAPLTSVCHDPGFRVGGERGWDNSHTLFSPVGLSILLLSSFACRPPSIASIARHCRGVGAWGVHATGQEQWSP